MSIRFVFILMEKTNRTRHQASNEKPSRPCKRTTEHFSPKTFAPPGRETKSEFLAVRDLLAPPHRVIRHDLTTVTFSDLRPQSSALHDAGSAPLKGTGALFTTELVPFQRLPGTNRTKPTSLQNPLGSNMSIMSASAAFDGELPSRTLGIANDTSLVFHVRNRVFTEVPVSVHDRFSLAHCHEAFLQQSSATVIVIDCVYDPHRPTEVRLVGSASFFGSVFEVVGHLMSPFVR